MDFSRFDLFQNESAQSRAFLSNVLEGIGEGVVVIDKEYRILTANRGYLNQAGREREQVIGSRCFAVSHHYDSPCEGKGHECPVRTVFETGLPAKAIHVHFDRDDREVFVECHAYPIKDAEGRVVRAIETLNNVTERVQLEQRLKESEEKYRDLYDNAPDGYYSVIGSGLIVEANTAFLEMIGRRRQEVMGKLHVEDLLSGESAELCKRHFPEFKKAGRIENLELTLVKKDGSPLPVMMNASAIFDEGKNFIMSRSVIRDITERKKADEEKSTLREQLYQSQKLEALGTLAGGIAHDFNNLLASIMGYASLAKTDLPSSDPLYRQMDIIETAAHRASELTRQLLAFAKGGKYDTQPNDVNAIVREVGALLSRTVDKKIVLELELDDALKPVVCDAGQIQQALLNLCINGRDAMPGGGTLTIRTQNVSLGIKETQYFIDVTPGEYVRISVSDTGSGMDRETQQHIFDPFFTTKEKGTGLGLSLVYGIIKKHNGFIHVASVPGKGSTFEVNLTACGEEQPCVKRGEPREVKRGTGTILVVDDEPLVVQLAGDILRRFGYSVLTADGGQEAVELFQNAHHEISAVILDVVMPGMDGREVFSKLRALDPRATIILSSGYNRDRDADDLQKQGAAAFIQKPYRIADLVRVVGEAIKKKTACASLVSQGPESNGNENLR